MNDGQLNATTQRWFVIAGGIGLLPILLVGYLMTRALPPPSPMSSGARIAQLLSEHPNVVQAGCVILMMGFALYALWGSVITLWIWRMESSRQWPLLTIASAVLLAVQVTMLELIPWSLATATYRASSISPDITRIFSDFGWFGLIWIFPPFLLWFGVVAMAMLRDRSTPRTFPRWLGWFTAAVGLHFVLAGFMGVSKSGPLSSDGIIAYWGVLMVFGIWEVVFDVYLLKAITAEERRLRAISSPEAEPMAQRSAVLA